MTKRIVAAAILIVLSVFWLPKSTRAETVYTTKTLYSVADIWVSNFKANENGGDDASISIGFFGAELRLGLIKFDLSEIPSNATITSASFNLYMIQTETGCNGTPSPNLLMIGQNTSDWAEGTTGWNGKPGYSTWQSYSSPACPAHWYYISTTDIVRNWIGGQPNYGFQILGPDGGNTYYRNFNTRESASSWARPQLVVSYSYPRPEDPAPASNPSNTQPSDSNSTASSSNNSTQTPTNTIANPGSNPSSSSSNVSTSPAGSSSEELSIASPTESNTSDDKSDNLSNSPLKTNKLLHWLNSLNMLERRLLVGGIIAIIIALIIIRKGMLKPKIKQKDK